MSTKHALLPSISGALKIYQITKSYLFGTLFSTTTECNIEKHVCIAIIMY